MLDFLLLIGLLAILGTGSLTWKLGRRDHRRSLPEAPMRRREDARDWQRRFGVEALLAADFLQPTQNEILETLCVLDHLTPGWEAGRDEAVESHFLHELAMSFPSLRRPRCAFPLPFAESLAAKSVVGHGRKKRPVTEEEIAARRESFRNSRAQSNALEQIIAGSPVGPVAMTPGSLPFRVSGDGTPRRAWNPWPGRFAWAAVAIAVFIGATYFLDRAPGMKAVPVSYVEPPVSPAMIPATTATVAVVTESAPEAPAAVKPVAAPASTATPEPIAMATPAPVTAPPLLPAAKLSTVKIALNSQIAASQQRAIDKYPDLAVEGSEINLRFVFRYKNLVQENSPRLHDPNWPEQLVEECAAAAAMTAKRNRLTQIADTNR